MGYETQTLAPLNLIANTVLPTVQLRPSATTLPTINVVTFITEKSPTTFETVRREQLEPYNLGQDLPILLQLTPSTVVTSDAGNGIGYTAMRIRGSDATRINTTINGVPLNEAESQAVFWVDLPRLCFFGANDGHSARGGNFHQRGGGFWWEHQYANLANGRFGVCGNQQ